MQERLKKALIGVNKIRQILLNYDLEIASLNGQIDYLKIKLQQENARLYRIQKPTKKDLNKKFSLKNDIAVARSSLHLLIAAKERLTKAIEGILNIYEPEKKKIWIEFFIQRKKLQDIANENHYSLSGLKKITARFICDLSINPNFRNYANPNKKYTEEIVYDETEVEADFNDIILDDYAEQDEILEIGEEVQERENDRNDFNQASDEDLYSFGEDTK